MNPLFEGIYKAHVGLFREQLEKAWDKFGGRWISELTGTTLDELENPKEFDDKDEYPIHMKDYRDFGELSAEEQYAFACWLKEKEVSVE